MHGCEAADASTGNDVTTITTPQRLVTKRASVPAELRGNHHDVEIRGHHSFLDLQSSTLFLATHLNDQDGAAPAAPAPHLATLWTVMEIAETRARVKARASPRVNPKIIPAPRVGPQTEKMASHRATSTVTANANMAEPASSGTLQIARACSLLGLVDSKQIARTNMQAFARSPRPMPSAQADPSRLQDPTPQVDDRGVHLRRDGVRAKTTSLKLGVRHRKDRERKRMADIRHAAGRTTHSCTWVQRARWRVQTCRTQTPQSCLVLL